MGSLWLQLAPLPPRPSFASGATLHSLPVLQQQLVMNPATDPARQPASCACCACCALLCLQRLVIRSTFVLLVTIVAVVMVRSGGLLSGAHSARHAPAVWAARPASNQLPSCAADVAALPPHPACSPSCLPLPLQPSFTAVVGLVGSVCFFPLSVFFPMTMWIKVWDQGRKG